MQRTFVVIRYVCPACCWKLVFLSIYKLPEIKEYFSPGNMVEQEKLPAGAFYSIVPSLFKMKRRQEGLQLLITSKSSLRENDDC